MSGHSKWSTIKRKKGAADAKRGALFGKLSKAISVAARDGGGDTEMNPALGLAVQKAKDANMPNDNIQRAIDKGTGAGADAYLFERKGVILVPKDSADEEELMEVALDSGAEDVEEQENDYRVVTTPEDFSAVREALGGAEIPYENAEITIEPQNSIDLDAGTARQTLRLIDALEENDDVQEVYANFDISEEVMAEVIS